MSFAAGFILTLAGKNFPGRPAAFGTSSSCSPMQALAMRTTSSASALTVSTSANRSLSAGSSVFDLTSRRTRKFLVR